MGRTTIKDVMLEISGLKLELSEVKKELEVVKADKQQLADNDMALKRMIDELKAKNKQPQYFG